MKDKETEGRVYADESPIHGKGLFAAVEIEKDEYIGRYRGPRAKRDGRYVLWVEEEDGELYGVSGRNVLRFLNHSTRPNAEFDGEELYALKRIREGDEITFHYGDEWADVIDPPRPKKKPKAAKTGKKRRGAKKPAAARR